MQNVERSYVKEDNMTLSYEENLKLGQDYEKFVTEKLQVILSMKITRYNTKWTQLRGENKEGIEIKYDRLMRKFNRIYIETAEKRNAYNPKYAPSGICRGDNTKIYIIGDYDTAYIFDIKDLLLLYKQKPRWVYHPPMTKTSIGFCIPIEYARKLAMFIVYFTDMRAVHREFAKRLKV